MNANIFFIADLHLGHANIIEHANRPFANTDEMDTAIIQNWLEVVRPNDKIYVLGDFAWKMWYYHEILPILPGNIFFVPGNHDEKVLNVAKRYVQVIDRLTILKIGGNYLTLCHYPLQSWYHRERQAWHFHGHLHGCGHHGEVPQVDRRVDVGVDCHDFYPVTFEQILDEERYRKLQEWYTKVQGEDNGR